MNIPRALPPGYVEAGHVELAGNRRLLAGMTVAALLVLLLCCLGLGGLASLVRHELTASEATFATPGEALVVLGPFGVAAAITPILVIAAHEALHGAAFWYFTRSRPRFGLTGWYAYATAPGCYFSRGEMVAVGLAPFVTISAASLAGAWLAPAPLAMLLLLAGAVNAAGAVGDVYFTFRLLGLPAAAVVEDRPDGMTWYLPRDTTHLDS
jgi:hypothetical protein